MPSPHALRAEIGELVSVNWIINRRMDLAWFIGGGLAGYVLFFVHAGFRQHYGSMRLYQKKDGDTDPVGARLDSLLLYSGLLLPFLVFIVRHPEARVQFGVGESISGYPMLPGGSRLLAPFSPEYLSALAVEHWIVAISAAVIGTLDKTLRKDLNVDESAA